MENIPISQSILKRKFLVSLALLSAGASFAFVLGAWLNFDALSEFFYRGSYYFVFALVIAWSSILFTFMKKTFSFKASLQEQWSSLLFAWGTAAILAFSVTPYFNVPTGEPLMLITSKSMLYRKTVSLIPSADPHGFSFRQGYDVDVKPFLFPFLLNLIHTVRGYNASNVFALNFILMGVFLTILCVCVRRTLDSTAAAASCLFVASSPLFSLCARSAGADLLFMVFISASILCVHQFIKQPGGSCLGLLWATLLMTAHIREESFIYFFIILGGLGCLGYLKREHFRGAAPLCLQLRSFFSLSSGSVF